MCLLILLLIVLLKKLNQPYLVAYVFAGIVLGPHITGIFSEPENISVLGDVGILLLMFFLGIEINIPGNRTLLLKSFTAQSVRTLLSIIFSVFLGKWLGWNTGYIFLLAVTFIFNSTAVVSEFLRKNHKLSTQIGKTVLNILLLQDLMLAPTLTFLQFLSKGEYDITKLLFSLIGCVLIFFLLRAIRNKNLVQLKFFKEIGTDHELQVFTAVAICLGFALITSFAGLTPAIGSFVAGVYIGRTSAFHWLENVLRPFKIFFVSLFFLSVGLMLDLHYIREHYPIIITLTFGILFINGLLSVIVFRLMKFSWRDSMYAGTLLSQTGEFGLLACSLAHQLNIIDYNFFKSSLAVIGLSLLLSSIWMTILKDIVYVKNLVNSD
ncbi:cation:proton antiporter [Chitinophagaceae bacterium LB-8]|uniref:Cation:proton antiporter n=1 Tax=Paraflavisolibacter caeni TaxID=2982496 RepID=A0A9X3BGN5_9BACT|nr:cation:proton antiporter [Paraflavisolibacter caeni]MCU7547883.1 cation:proton antiporter [Paraflavisolibacter caeni]